MEEQPQHAQAIRLVLAEDHALVREGTRRILEAAGNITVVAEASEGEEAVTAVSRHRADVALIDIGMPGISGIEATRRIKESHPNVGVLILTMHDDDQFILAALEAGAAGYLLKDVEGHQLIQAVEAVHAGESVLHPAVTHKVLALLVSQERAVIRPGLDDPLTERELEVLKLAARGMANKEIGASLHLSVRTVESHLSRVFHKLQVGSRTEAILHGLRRGWFTVDDLEPPT